MMVFVAGGTGFVGRSVVRRLIADGRQVRALTRDSRGAAAMERLGAKTVRGDLKTGDRLADSMKGADVAVNLVGIIKEAPKAGVTFEEIHYLGAKRFARAAAEAGVKKIVHMSALGTREDAESEYHRTKFLGEHAVMESGVPYTIIRPSAQLGPRGEFADMMIDLISKAPVLPVFGDGQYMMQPMDVEDTARIFSLAVDRPGTENQIYEVGGPRQMTYIEMLDAFMQALKVKRPKILIPWPIANLMVKMMQLLPNPPITKTQYTMLKEDNICDNTDVIQALGVRPGPIEPVLEKAVKAWKDKKG